MLLTVEQFLSACFHAVQNHRMSAAVRATIHNCYYDANSGNGYKLRMI